MLAKRVDAYSGLEQLPEYLRGEHRKIDGIVWYVCQICASTLEELAKQLPPEVIDKCTHLVWFGPGPSGDEQILESPVPMRFVAGEIRVLSPE